ncbi:MAG: methionyl-tRNA formyltransferase [Peptostreptococcales bacterium]
MKIIFMGTPEFAAVALDKLIHSDNEVLACVTQPDKPKGRGKKIQFSPVKELALQHGIRVMQPITARDEEFIKEIERLDPDSIVVAAYGNILPKRLLDIPKYGCINIHGSLLPRYRGAAPIHWAVIEGEEVTGVTIMYMEEGLDTGDMLLKSEVKIGNKTTGELHDILAEMGADLVVKALKDIENGRIVREPQKEEESSYASMLNKEMGQIDWSKKAETIEALIRGLNPWPLAYTKYRGTMMKVFEAELTDKLSTGQKSGEILAVSDEGIEVATQDKNLLIKKIQFPNKKAMTVADYLRGNPALTGIFGEQI